MKKLSLALLAGASLAAASIAAPADAAVTVPFTFSGGNLFAGGSGSGSFTTSIDNGSVGLGTLDSFSLAGTGGAFIFGVSYAFDKLDLTGFSATLANGVVTALSFDTASKQVPLSLLGFPIGTTDLKFNLSGLGTDTLTATNSLVGDVKGTLTIGTGAVPEPATWATMIGGLGLAGFALRRRQQRVRVTYA